MIVELKSVVPRLEHIRFQNPIDWILKEQENWAIIGPNGAGKTLLVDILMGKYAIKTGEVLCFGEDGKSISVSGAVKCVAFRDIYSIIDVQNSYYQQRWNKGDEHEVPLVRDIMKTADNVWLDMLLEWFSIAELMAKEVTMLSSGELRKVLIVRSLLSKPRVLILDNPFIGLDAASRKTLDDLLSQVSKMDGLQIVLILSNPDDIPPMVTDILPVYQKGLLPAVSLQQFLGDSDLKNMLFSPLENIDLSHLNKGDQDQPMFENAAILKDIHIRYGSRTILRNLDWQVKRGEKWALLGANGAGKSTLLSLVCGDNPQAYANNITLFDRKRGTGESIWDIKKRIGYISPEMHLYYLKNVRCLDVVGSGFFDTVGLYRKCNEEQEVLALEWMKVFRIDHLKEISFLNISSGEQRLALLARLFVKNPDLLILDEPLHGLDAVNKMYIKKLIEEYCGKDKALIYVTHYESEIPDIIDKRLLLTKIG